MTLCHVPGKAHPCWRVKAAISADGARHWPAGCQVRTRGFRIGTRVRISQGDELGSEPAKVDVVIAMGSVSDLTVMQRAKEVLDAFAIPCELRVLSAHRTPMEMLSFARGAADAGVKVIIAGAGGAAHLPGMIASATTLPVIGVPVGLRHLSGLDSLLSIVQMPRGVPVATVAIDNASNAGYLAARILGISDDRIRDRLVEAAQVARLESLAKDAALSERDGGS